MTCDDLRDYYELYALGVVESPERDEIRAHLDRECQTCTAGVREARQFTALLSSAAEPAAPSRALRKRILASVSPPRSRFPWPLAWAALVSVLSFTALYTGFRSRAAEHELARVREQAGAASSRLARLSEALAILNGAETVEAAFGTAQPRGRVYVHPSRGVLLLASNLRPAPSGKAYEMWVIPKAGRPVPAGLFQPEPNGTAMHILVGPIDPGATGAIAVTLEDEAGAAQPTTQPLIVAALARPTAAR